MLDDDRLAREVARGNEAAFEVMYDRHHSGLLSFCRHLLGSVDEAEDALQQTFVSAYKHLTRNGSDVRLKPWLYTIARNRCISTIRARHTEPADDIEPSTDGLHQEVQQRADLRQLLADMQLLPVDQRAALILSELKGMSHRDVAEVLDCDTKKVKALVFQARSHLLEYRAAHDAPCVEVRREIAARKRGAPTSAVRRHVAVCEDCALFRKQVREQRSALGLLLPVVPAAGLKSSALGAAGLAGGSSAGTGVAGGAWLACNAQAVKLAALGAAALTAAAVTVPLLSGGSQPAHAGSEPVVTRTPSLRPLTTGGHAFPQVAGARPAARASKGVASVGPTIHLGHRTARHDTKARAEHRDSHHRVGGHRHGADSGDAIQPTAPSVESDDGHGHAYAYGHLHAPGWIRHHGGDAPAPGRVRGLGHRHHH